ncbi:hypothetical protein CALVIDRAFT_45801 [Calocera viscosa TUFC12733]|uniref:Uncharacterized protein n=1 Tax=Calocera viscosa (strain TUFC12733) TaxID=1330018 RepID=A0A167P5B8_CALVF|nr:hypothetical protein CALVIDRAFT_45801 [Calocera viscosa TUFC12733]
MPGGTRDTIGRPAAGWSLGLSVATRLPPREARRTSGVRGPCTYKGGPGEGK